MGCVQFKDGVTLKPNPAGARILGTLDRVARQLPFDLTITCGADSHPVTDPHSRGQAFDVRTHGLTDDQKTFLVREALLDLQDGEPDAPEELSIAGIWFALATRRWFGQIEHHGQDGEHLHLQLRKGATLPITTGDVLKT